MNLVLVDNLMLPDEGSLAMLDVHPHLGLLALAAVAEADGHTVQIYDPKRRVRAGELPYDPTIYERAAGDLLALGPQAVGFTTLGCSFLFALGVAAELKRRAPDLPILLGGPHATMLDRPILERFRQFDVVVRHEADEIFPAVLANLERRRFDWIPGITWRDARGVRATDGKPKVEDLDALPIASYDHYPVADLGLDLFQTYHYYPAELPRAHQLGAYVGDGRGGGACWIGPGVQAIAELFVEPHTCREVADLVCTAIGATELDLGVFEGLVRAGVLVASPAQAP